MAARRKLRRMPDLLAVSPGNRTRVRANMAFHPALAVVHTASVRVYLDISSTIHSIDVIYAVRYMQVVRVRSSSHLPFYDQAPCREKESTSAMALNDEGAPVSAI